MSGPSPKEIATDIADDFIIGGTPRTSFIDIVGDAIRDYSARAADRIAELEAEREATIAIWKGRRIRELEAKIGALRKALVDLSEKEAAYRLSHDTMGDGHIEAGRAWDQMRKSGNRARSLLSEGGGE